jgi:hypothetical protein
VCLLGGPDSAYASGNDRRVGLNHPLDSNGAVKSVAKIRGRHPHGDHYRHRAKAAPSAGMRQALRWRGLTARSTASGWLRL